MIFTLRKHYFVSELPDILHVKHPDNQVLHPNSLNEHLLKINTSGKVA